MRVLRRVLRRVRNWWRYGVWTPCPHRWALRQLTPHDGTVTTAHYYWACSDCGASISFVREMQQ